MVTSILKRYTPRLWMRKTLSKGPSDSHPILRLPQELWDEIVGYIDHDWATFSACSLTYRAWATAFRPHLFHHLRITARSLSHIQQILHSNAHLAKYTTRVTIDYEGDPSVLLQLRQHTVLAKVLSTLPNVIRLKLLSSAVTPSLISALSGLSSRVRELTLGRLVATSLEAYAQFIRAFPHLRTLSLEGVSSVLWGYWDVYPTLLIRLMLQRRLKRDWQRATDRLRARGDGDHPTALDAIIQNIPPSLEYLCVESRTWSIFHPPVPRRTDHTSVRSLELKFMTRVGVYWSSTFFCYTTMTGIREISFHFYIPVDVSFEGMVRSLSQMLSPLIFPQLQTVTFMIWIAQTDRVEDYTANLELICEILPDLHAAGSLVLRILRKSHAAEVRMYRWVLNLGARRYLVLLHAVSKELNDRIESDMVDVMVQ
ncbi:predicted protein [Postia placenta Mad-698-R]|nr:predicted protein [Postia placenta Mad-698-R]